MRSVGGAGQGSPRRQRLPEQRSEHYPRLDRGNCGHRRRTEPRHQIVGYPDRLRCGLSAWLDTDVGQVDSGEDKEPEPRSREPNCLWIPTAVQGHGKADMHEGQHREDPTRAEVQPAPERVTLDAHAARFRSKNVTRLLSGSTTLKSRSPHGRSCRCARGWRIPRVFSTS